MRKVRSAVPKVLWTLGWLQVFVGAGIGAEEGAPLQAPRSFSTCLGDHGSLLQCWGGLQPSPSLSLQPGKAPICIRKHASGFCVKTNHSNRCNAIGTPKTGSLFLKVTVPVFVLYGGYDPRLRTTGLDWERKRAWPRPPSEAHELAEWGAGKINTSLSNPHLLLYPQHHTGSLCVLIFYISIIHISVLFCFLILFFKNKKQNLRYYKHNFNSILVLCVCFKNYNYSRRWSS